MLKQSPQITLPSGYGDLNIIVFENAEETACLVWRESVEEVPFVRIHSSCVFSEALGTSDCDCDAQLKASLRYLADQGGYIIYLYQEGRGAGLFNKVRAISVEQTEDVDTGTAFERLGLQRDLRSYALAGAILNKLDIREVQLATNNPTKLEAVQGAGISVKARVKLVLETTSLIDDYIAKKEKYLGHYGDD